MNEYDSQCITRQMIDSGFESSDEIRRVDVILFNTCSVREHAAQRFYTNLGATLELKNRNPELIVGVCGCVAEQEGNRLFDRFPWVKLVTGPGNIALVGDAIKRIVENKSRILMTGFIGDVKEKCSDSPSFALAKLSGGVTIARKNKDSALVTIIRGCNNFCSYCVVPYLRGREQSRPMDEIIEEVRQVVRDGYKEIMLLGQNVCAYKDSRASKSKNDFAKLLKEINEIEGIEKIKFMTSHPRDVNQELIEAVATLDKVCKEFHLPVQSGSDKILKAMHRGYTREYYINLINKIRGKIRGVRVTTDIIVGFPDETEEDFNQTLDLVKKIKFDDAFTFKYSDRPNTIALKLENKISNDVKIERLKQLMDAVKEAAGQKEATDDEVERRSRESKKACPV